VLAESAELAEILPDDYRTERLSIAEAVRKILDEEELPALR
jgi:hypothetical protein